jgi:hypothetical protein
MRKSENIYAHALLLNKTVLRGFMQNHAGPKNMCKKTRKTCAGQSSIGGGRGGGDFSTSQSFPPT